MDKITSFLNQPTIEWSGHTITLSELLVIPTILLGSYILTKWINRFISRRLIAKGVDINNVFLVRRLLYVVAIVIVVITILDVINVPLTAFAFISGAVAIGVGFGAQNIINNFISGWILMWERPIGIGDFHKSRHKIRENRLQSQVTEKIIL